MLQRDRGISRFIEARVLVVRARSLCDYEKLKSFISLGIIFLDGIYEIAERRNISGGGDATDSLKKNLIDLSPTKRESYPRASATRDSSCLLFICGTSER